MSIEKKFASQADLTDKKISFDNADMPFGTSRAGAPLALFCMSRCSGVTRRLTVSGFRKS